MVLALFCIQEYITVNENPNGSWPLHGLALAASQHLSASFGLCPPEFLHFFGAPCRQDVRLWLQHKTRGFLNAPMSCVVAGGLTRVWRTFTLGSWSISWVSKHSVCPPRKGKRTPAWANCPGHAVSIAMAFCLQPRSTKNPISFQCKTERVKFISETSLCSSRSTNLARMVAETMSCYARKFHVHIPLDGLRQASLLHPFARDGKYHQRPSHGSRKASVVKACARLWAIQRCCCLLCSYSSHFTQSTWSKSALWVFSHRWWNNDPFQLLWSLWKMSNNAILFHKQGNIIEQHSEKDIWDIFAFPKPAPPWSVSQSLIQSMGEIMSPFIHCPSTWFMIIRRQPPLKTGGGGGV